MLRLEHSKNHSVSIKVRDSNRFLNQTFLKALAIAVGIHLTAAVLFHVQIFRIIGSEKTFPPVTVRSELTDLMEVDASEIAIKPQKALWLKKPKSPYPAVPQYPQISLEKLEDKLLPECLDPQRCKTGLQVVISGGLENKKTIPNTLVGMNPPATTFSARYQVRVDDPSGEVIWYEPETKNIDTGFTEQLLQQLRFEEDLAGAISSGWIEIAYRGGSDD